MAAEVKSPAASAAESGAVAGEPDLPQAVPTTTKTYLVTLPQELILDIIKLCVPPRPLYNRITVNGTITISQLSLVDKSLREMCVPILFRSLKLSTDHVKLLGHIQVLENSRVLEIVQCVLDPSPLHPALNDLHHHLGNTNFYQTSENNFNRLARCYSSMGTRHTFTSSRASRPHAESQRSEPVPAIGREVIGDRRSRRAREAMYHHSNRQEIRLRHIVFKPRPITFGQLHCVSFRGTAGPSSRSQGCYFSEDCGWLVDHRASPEATQAQPPQLSLDSPGYQRHLQALPENNKPDCWRGSI